MQFEQLDMNVLVGKGGQLWVSARSRLGAVYAVPRAKWPRDLTDATETLADAVRFADPVEDQAKAIGAMLSDLLFGDPESLALFQRTRGAAADQGRPLIVRVLGAPHEIGALPWELTLDPEHGRHEFLTLAPDVHVLRLARARTYPIHTEPIPPPLHVLLVLSSPTVVQADDDAVPFDVYEERRSILSELEPLVYDAGRITVDIEDRPSVENLRRRISGRTRGYHIVHYLGHANPEALVLENRQGTRRDVDAADFTQLLQGCPDLRLVVYAGCLTASLPPRTDDDPVRNQRGDWDRALSIADLSVRVAAPAVVGMQAVLPFRTEYLFVRFFYRALASGRSLADAVQLARAAIRSDEIVGELFDWAVPAVYLGGEDPGPLIDVSGPPEPVPRPVRKELKLGLEEEERSFFARPVQLRMAMNVLSGHSPARALVVTGTPDVRTSFVARVLSDLGDDVGKVLYLRAREFRGAPDPVYTLCEWVAELLDGDAQQPQPEWTGIDWWNRLLQTVVLSPAVLAIDDLEELTEPAAGDLFRVFGELALRSGRARLVLAGAPDCGIQERLGGRAAQHAQSITLRPLEWSSVLRWIRRNLPELLRREDDLLDCYKSGFQDDFGLWNRLAQELANEPKGTDPRKLAPGLLGARPPAPAQPTGPPLRAALANPALAQEVERFADWITSLANDRRVGGRVLDPGRAVGRASIAQLVPIATPFDERGTATDATTLAWANAAVADGTDVLLLDFGSPFDSKVWREVCSRLSAQGVLLIGVGGNGGNAEPTYPSWCPEVLTVGALRRGRPARYASWNPAENKPEIFAPEDLTWADPAHTVTGGRPDSFQAALGVLAAALVVWSVDRRLPAAEVRRILLDTASRKPATRNGKRTWFHQLDLEGALACARTRLLFDILQRGPASERELIAATGLSRDLTVPLLDELRTTRRIRAVEGPDTTRYELTPQPAAAEARAAGQQPRAA